MSPYAPSTTDGGVPGPDPGPPAENAAKAANAGEATARRDRGPSGLGLALVVAGALAVVQLVVVIAFAWPNARSGPHDVPIVLAGPSQSVAAVEGHMAEARPGAFDTTVRDDEKAARQAIEDRDAYAAIVADPAGPKVLVSSAASSAVAAAFTQIAGEIEQQSGKPVTVEDVRAAPEKDSRGAAFGSSLLPLVLTGLIGGVLITLKITGLRDRLVAAATFAVAAGLCTTAVVHGWIGALDGNYLAEASAVGLVVFTITVTMAGLGTALGHQGLGLGLVTILLLGNPLSGVATAPEMLPEPWGALGQLLPPGAGASLLRSTSFFDGAGSAGPLAVLSTWAAVGLTLLVVGNARTSRAKRLTAVA
ncbi:MULTISPECIES: ABC transporter permease [unclassified Streptomyces]|uniref:ABC transporter permease n=1 Tax=unclassified Streptomyces TaxID=2593676 RepID=UPI0036ECA7AD